jgi:hypothetical protein
MGANVTHTLEINRFDPTDPRLGRHVNHDSRSLAYEFLPRKVTPAGKNTLWVSPYAPLNQGETGACTGNATAQVLNTRFMAAVRLKLHKNRKFSEGDAIRFYSLATQLDTFPGAYPPDDTGSDGVSVAAAAKKMGYLDQYSHTFSFQSAQRAAELTPFIQGTVWTNKMFKPVNGLVTVGKITDATIAGGHEYAGVGIDFTAEVFVYRNSWGDEDQWPGCKPGGYFAIGFKDVAALLAEQGDVTILHGTGMP